jgi:hypothetical protein
MAPLDSPRWSTLAHAYGSAADIPPLLRLIASDVAHSSTTDGPWFELWSALYHQGDIFTASFAAVPHLLKILTNNSADACFDFFLMPASIEVTRSRRNIPIPPDLADAYFDSLHGLPAAITPALVRPWDDSLGRSILAAIAASKGHIDTAQTLIEVDTQDTTALLEWYFSR